MLRSQTPAHNTLAYLLLQSQFELSQRAAFLRVYNFQRELWKKDSHEWAFEIDGWTFKVFTSIDLACCFATELYEHHLWVNVQHEDSCYTQKHYLQKAGANSTQKLPLRKQEPIIKSSFLKLLSKTFL